MVIFAVVTAVLSALLDNVTIVLLITPAVMLIAEALEVDAVTYLISSVLASNIGGTATLIGDPPNLMIASKAQLSFMDFIVHLDSHRRRPDGRVSRRHQALLGQNAHDP